MNNILELKGNRFHQEKKNIKGGGASMNSQKVVDVECLYALENQLKKIQEFWRKEEKPFSGIFISVYYNKIVAKSNRIAGLFKGKQTNYAIVGAKFNQEKNRHIITYYLDDYDVHHSIELISNVRKILNHYLDGKIDRAVFSDQNQLKKIPFDKMEIPLSTFKQVVADVSYIDAFDIERSNQKLKQSIITLYNTEVDVRELLKSMRIDVLSTRVLDNQTVYLDEKQSKYLLEKAPYLVAMATEDLAEFTPEDFMDEKQSNVHMIPSPLKDAPTIGVIDTLFNKNVYFSEWVDYHDMVDDNLSKTLDDCRHGTAVSSIIVDGPTMNPWLDDGCGRFKVRHFGVATGSRFSSFTIIKQIKNIVAQHRDIKVWNISLGSNQEINDNFISAEAAVLDQIQYENDVIFVIAGTNKPSADISKIGSPADSINSIVVNAVTKSGLSTNYARSGLALSFFAKPDVSYYGGSEEQYIKVYDSYGEAFVAGTSFAAPWIARKLSYLIDVLGFNRELAKALIIDAARGWNDKLSIPRLSLYGHGIVPINIMDILQTSSDEIKFLVSDTSEKWNTYNYKFPIPLADNKYPYVARATMCYFPKCDRTQGVDYTNTELNLHFGRIKDDGKLNEINHDKQNQEESTMKGLEYLLEKEVRSRFRKWDNVKYVIEPLKENMQAKKSYKDNKNWGMEIKTNNRLDPKDGEKLRFGVVVTIKEIHGVNRIEEFKRNCHLNGWIVREVDIKNRIDIYQTLNEEIEFEK